MSTTLHVFVEKRVGDRWVFLPAPNVTDGDWFDGHYGREAMAVMCGACNDDGYKPAVEWRAMPDDITPELVAAAGFLLEESRTWMLLSELESYDFDQSVTKMVRTYSPEELAKLGWLGNGDGTPYGDVQRHLRGREGERQLADGYAERPVSVRVEARELLLVMAKIKEAAAGVASDQVRLVVCIFY